MRRHDPLSRLRPCLPAFQSKRGVTAHQSPVIWSKSARNPIRLIMPADLKSM